MFNGARILITPLDWGLGHSTRDVPVIQRLLELDARPIIGADKGPLALLRDTFPHLPHVRVPGVDVRYASGASQAWAMAAQFPAMLRSIRAEHHLFLRLRQELRLQAVISDQRFGMHAPALPSVLITHQVHPFTPLAQGLLRRINRNAIARFDRCWIPDEEQAPGLAGELSHGTHLPRNARYIGVISRLDPKHVDVAQHNHRIVCVISGPEPQRTRLETALMAQLPAIPGKHLLVLGKPQTPIDEVVGNVHRVSHLGAEALTAALLRAELIVSRTGYTTLMDLAHLGRTALLVPTPGQAEQEYLGRVHAATGRFHVQQQDQLDVSAVLSLDRPAPTAVHTDHTPLERALQDLAALIRTTTD